MKKDKKKKGKKLNDLEVETLIKDLRADCLAMTKFHLAMVKQTTGEIIVEDVTYCIELTERIVNYIKN